MTGEEVPVGVALETGSLLFVFFFDASSFEGILVFSFSEFAMVVSALTLMVVREWMNASEEKRKGLVVMKYDFRTMIAMSCRSDLCLSRSEIHVEEISVQIAVLSKPQRLCKLL